MKRLLLPLTVILCAAVLVFGQSGGYVSPASGGTPAGANTQVQFNNNGAFGADAGLTYVLGANPVLNIGPGSGQPSITFSNGAPGIAAAASQRMIRFGRTHQIAWKNFANNNELTLLTDTNDNLVWGGTGAANFGFISPIYKTATKCAQVGSAANPSVAACSAAPTGVFSCATASAGNCTVNTTAMIDGNSTIIVVQDMSALVGTLLSVTCNTTASAIRPDVTARVAATSFSFLITTPTTNPDCFSYSITN